jgi:hypothetical protein
VRQTLAGAKEEGNVLPARIVDPGPLRHERLDGRLRRDPFLVPVPGHLVSLDHASSVLTPNELLSRERSHGLEQLRLPVANILRSERIGRLHRHERQHLEQVVPDHVGQRASLLVIANRLRRGADRPDPSPYA